VRSFDVSSVCKLTIIFQDLFRTAASLAAIAVAQKYDMKEISPTSLLPAAQSAVVKLAIIISTGLYLEGYIPGDP